MANLDNGLALLSVEGGCPPVEVGDPFFHLVLRYLDKKEFSETRTGKGIMTGASSCYLSTPPERDANCLFRILEVNHHFQQTLEVLQGRLENGQLHQCTS